MGVRSKLFTTLQKNDRLTVVEWVLTHRTEGKTNDALLGAVSMTPPLIVKGAKLEILEWLFHNRIDGCTTCVLQYALRDVFSVNGAFDAIRWLSSNSVQSGDCMGRCTGDPQRRTYVPFTVPPFALAHGHVEIARFFLAYDRLNFGIEPMNLVVRNGHFGAIQWVHANAPEVIDWQQALDAVSRTDGLTQLLEWLDMVACGKRAEGNEFMCEPHQNATDSSSCLRQSLGRRLLSCSISKTKHSTICT